ncbi:MAG: acyl-CoA dehydrogenase family protein, partial [Mycobacteriaceae bacterium]
MDFQLNADQKRWLEEVRGFLHENVTRELRAEMAEYDIEYLGGEVTRFRKKIGEKGWFGLNWPVEFGGLGLGAVYQHL